MIIVDNLFNSSEEVLDRIELISNKRPVFCNVDITDEKALDGVFATHSDIESVAHFAGLKVSKQIKISKIVLYLRYNCS